MKFILAAIPLIFFFAVPIFAQNTSLTYMIGRPPNPNRQVASMENNIPIARPYLPNSSGTSLGWSGHLRKKHKRRFITTEPIIIPEPDLNDKPCVQ